MTTLLRYTAMPAGEPLQVLVMDKNELRQQRVFELSPQMMLHVGNTHEEPDGETVLSYVGAPDVQFLNDGAVAMMQRRFGTQRDSQPDSQPDSPSKPGKSGELDAWLLGTTFDVGRHATVLNLLDAAHIEGGPVAQAVLPFVLLYVLLYGLLYGLPLGFHVNFTAV